MKDIFFGPKGYRSLLEANGRLTPRSGHRIGGGLTIEMTNCDICYDICPMDCFGKSLNLVYIAVII